MRNFIQVKKVHRRRGAKASRRLLRLYKSYFLLYHRFTIWQPLFRHIFAIIFIFLHFVNVTQTVCLFLTFPVILSFSPCVPHFFLLRDLRAQIFDRFCASAFNGFPYCSVSDFHALQKRWTRSRKTGYLEKQAEELHISL